MSSAEGISGSAAGGQLEERVDLSAETETKIQQAQALVTSSSSSLSEALALLAAHEKKCRVGNDTASLVRVCRVSVELCRNDLEALVATLETLSRRRSQKTAAVKALVQTALPWCVQEPYTPVPAETTEAQTARDRLVQVLLEITEGKIFLERERAQLTRALATIKEESGDVSGAAETLQDVHVETYGSLSKRDKVEFILEQLRLTLAKKDFVRAHIVSGKVSRKYLQEETMEEYKVRFYTLLTDYHRHEKDALELAKDYHYIYSTPHILADEAKWQPALQATVVFLMLSPHGNEQQDMMNRIAADTNLEKLAAFQTSLALFLKKEIIPYPLAHQTALEGLEVCQQDGLAAHWHEIFHRRIIQHNLRIVALYYKRIHGTRLAQLLQLDKAQLEQELSDMVSEGQLYAKMDRPQDIVRFAMPQSPEAILSDWAADIDKLLHLVETTSHLINKENMTAQ